jgi:hypothetical protein
MAGGEIGAKCSFVEPDEVTEELMRSLPTGAPDRVERRDGGVVGGGTGNCLPRARRAGV